MSPDLFTAFEPDTLAHDPGGKVRYPLPAGVCGEGPGPPFHGPNDCYRTTLWRRWGKARECAHAFYPFALLIGMNPSTATPRVNDPTLNKDDKFVREWDLEAFCKTNVGDYRATHPRELLNLDISPVSDRNVPTIRRLACSPSCQRIVLGYGVVNRALAPHAVQLVSLLRADGHKLYCWKRTKDGHPQHELYIAYGTPLQEF